MEPLHQNLLTVLASAIYATSVIGLCDVLVAKELLASRVSRKIIHVMGGTMILFWSYYNEDHWSWVLNVTIPVVYMVKLFAKGAIIRDPNDQDVQTMTRTGNPVELLYGPLYFTIILNTVGLFFFRQATGVAMMACLGFGDGIAPLAGHYLGFGSYPTFPFGPKDRKSLAGSLGFFASSILGFYVFRSVSEQEIDPTKMLQTVAMATVTEGISGAYDNILIPVSVYLSETYL